MQLCATAEQNCVPQLIKAIHIPNAQYQMQSSDVLTQLLCPAVCPVLLDEVRKERKKETKHDTTIELAALLHEVR
jgi:hypothetical protein